MEPTSGRADSAALDVFSSDAPLDQRLESLKLLMKEGLPTTDARFARGCEALLGEVRSGDEAGRLHAIAALRKVINKLDQKSSAELEEKTSRLLQTELPLLGLLKDPQDRERVMEAIATVSAEWVAPYASRALVEEPPGATRVRTAAAGALLHGTGDLARVADAVRSQLVVWEPRTRTPADTTATLVGEILESIRAALLMSSAGIGVRSAESLAHLVATAGSKAGGAPTKAAARVIDATASLLEHVLRSRFSLATSAEMYGPIRRLREWVAPTDMKTWSRLMSGSKSASSLVEVVDEALTVVAKQHIADDQLFEVLVLLTGSRDLARSRAARIADDLAIPEAVRAWLKGDDYQVAAAPERSHSADVERLADILQSFALLDLKIPAISESAVSELELLAPRLAPPLQLHFTQVRQLSHDFRQLCALRNIGLRGAVGDVERFAPSMHRLDQGAADGVGWVRILRPAVEHQVADGFVRLILPALVEPAEPPKT